MANYTKTTIGKESRIELHEKLSLTGAEISLNELPAGANVPFVHSHKENEEIYGILSGNGKAIIDGSLLFLADGSIAHRDGKNNRKSMSFSPKKPPTRAAFLLNPAFYPALFRDSGSS